MLYTQSKLYKCTYNYFLVLCLCARGSCLAFFFFLHLIRRLKLDLNRLLPIFLHCSSKTSSLDIGNRHSARREVHLCWFFSLYIGMFCAHDVIKYGYFFFGYLLISRFLFVCTPCAYTIHITTSVRNREIFFFF